MLKAKAGEIVRNVQKGARYVISIRGRPVALIIPVEPVPESQKQDAWEALYQVGSLLEWNTSRTTEELLNEVRG
jgi:prevent-host-death family protein